MSKAVLGNNETGDDGITNLPDYCLYLIFKCLETREDQDSFGLTCRHWLHIQSSTFRSLWYDYRHDYVLPKISPESFPKLLCQLLTRFQNVKSLSLTWLPKITDFDILQSQFSASRIRNLCLGHCEYSDAELSVMFSLFPRLTYVSLVSSSITDRGLEALAKSCSSLKTVNLSNCCSITDSGINFLLQNCCKVRKLYIDCCSNITGIGFIGCPKTLTHLEAGGCKLTPEGIKAIVSGGGLKYLSFATPYDFREVGEGCINTEAVVTISEGCPLLRELMLPSCKKVKLEELEAISNCRNLEVLSIFGENFHRSVIEFFRSQPDEMENWY